MAKALEFEYVTGGMVTYPPGATFGPRVLDDYELVWIVQGQVVYHCDGQDYPCASGSILLARPGFSDAFTWDRENQTRLAFIHFWADHLPADWPPPHHWPICRTMPDDDIVRPLFRHVLTQCDDNRYAKRQAPPPMVRRAVETMLGAYLSGQVGQVFEHDQDYPEPVSKALCFIRQQLDDNPARSLELDDLAAAASVSSEQLCRLFRQTLDLGPIEALRMNRLDRAMQLLSRSNLNIEQIAYRCGFASPFHFSRRFRQAFGQPPSVIRRLIAQGHPPPVTRLQRRSL